MKVQIWAPSMMDSQTGERPILQYELDSDNSLVNVHVGDCIVYYDHLCPLGSEPYTMTGIVLRREWDMTKDVLRIVVGKEI